MSAGGKAGDHVKTLDKRTIGERIKYLRKARGLRQWQVAKFLGATQPAVHKYENGILPEVKRLLEIARIGNTSIEWILTGRHWENGSTQMERLDSDVYHLAHQLSMLTPGDRERLADAVKILRAAVEAMRARRDGHPQGLTDAGFVPSGNAMETHALEPLKEALAIYDFVVSAIANSKVKELRGFGKPETATEIGEQTVGVAKLQESAG